MTHLQKLLIGHLLNGCHMMRSVGHTGKRCYRVFDRKKNAVLVVKEKTVANLSCPWLFKKDLHQKITLNLKSVRSLHGGNWIKAEYKRKQLFINKIKQHD